MSVTPLALLFGAVVFFAHWSFVFMWLDGAGGLKWVWTSSNPPALLKWVRVTFLGAQVAGIVMTIDNFRWPAGVVAVVLFALHFGLLFALSEVPSRKKGSRA